MTREERSGGLAAAARVDRTRLLELADRLAAGGAQVVEGPAPATVMVELESVAGVACLAEVVVTTASVERPGGRRGWGCVLGYDEAAALAVALCEGTDDAGVEDLAASALATEGAARDRVSSATAATRIEP